MPQQANKPRRQTAGASQKQAANEPRKQTTRRARKPEAGEPRLEETPYDRYPRLFERKCLKDYRPREVGLEGENLASYHLEKRGFELLERNWRCRYGEADIIALDDDEVVLVEVKTRIDPDGQYNVIPELAVDERKQKRYGLIAMAYLNDHPGLSVVRFDVVAVSLVTNDHARLRHLRNAFAWED